MKTLFKKQSNNYTLYGALFGLLFPIISTFTAAYLKYKNINFSSIILIQASNPLIWVIDSAPFFLGLFARIAGIRQDKVNDNIKKLKEANRIISDEMVKIKTIELELRKKNSIIEEDLKAAKIIQESFLPELPDINSLNICYKYIPMSDVGGDFLTIKKFNNKEIGFFIGDVSGHGVSASLLTSLTIVLLNRICRKYGYDPEEYLFNLNNELIKYMPEGRYLTCIYGLYYKERRKHYFKFARGGHPYPILWNSKKKEAELIKSPGVILGFSNDITFENIIINMKSNDRLFLYTDGIIEVENKKNKELGFEGLLEIITQCGKKNSTLEKTLDTIIKKIKKYNNTILKNDDRILIGIEIK